MNLATANPTQIATQRQFLRFRIAAAQTDVPTELAIEMSAVAARVGVTELIDIPSDRVVPIPHLPPAVMGVYNWRGSILWLVDLATVLGADPSYHNDRRRYPTIVVAGAADTSGALKTIGLIVAEIADIEWCELGSSPTALELTATPWFKGNAISTTGERLTLLDERAIIDRADLHAQI